MESSVTRSLKMLQGTGNPHTSCIILGNAVNKWLLFIWWMGNEKMLYLPKLLLLLFLMVRNGHNVSMLLYVPVEYNECSLGRFPYPCGGGLNAAKKNERPC